MLSATMLTYIVKINFVVVIIGVCAKNLNNVVLIVISWADLDISFVRTAILFRLTLLN